MRKEIRILIVEFYNENLDKVEKELNKSELNYKSRRVAAREGFIRELKEFSPSLIIANYVLPQFSSAEILSILEGKKNDIPILIISSKPDKEIALKCIREGADDFIPLNEIERLPGEIMNALSKFKIRKEKEKADKALKLSEELYRLITENSNDLISVVDKNGKIIYASPAHNIYLGFTPLKLKGKKIIDLVHKDYKKLFLNTFFSKKPEVDVTSSKIELKCKTNDGEWLWLETIGSEIITDNIRTGKTVFVSRDITERKEYEQELKAAKEKAEELARVKVEFLEALSKEVRDPLNVMMGYTSMLKETDGKNATEEEYLTYIESAGKNLIKSVDKILFMT